MNVGNEKPTTCLNAALKRVNPLSCELKREDIIAAFFNKFENLYDVFLEQGKLPFNFSTIMDVQSDFQLLKYKLPGLVKNMDVLECSTCLFYLISMVIHKSKNNHSVSVRFLVL